MSLFLFYSIILAIILIVGYIILGVRNKKSTTLEDIVQIFFGGLGVCTAIRLIGFVLSGQFSILVKQVKNDNIFSFSEEDAVYIVLGGIAIGWVSVQTMLGSFKKVAN